LLARGSLPIASRGGFCAHRCQSVESRVYNLPVAPLARRCFRGSRKEWRAMRRKAFTLIELLVVIAIIAIVTGILFPVFAQVRADARKSVCGSNFKQLMTAVLLYSQDYDEHYPLSGYRFECVLPNEALHTLIWSYMRNES